MTIISISQKSQCPIFTLKPSCPKLLLSFQRELNTYDTQQLQNEAHHRISSLNPEQRAIFDSIEVASTQLNPAPIFIGASPGTGKSYLLNTILSYFRSQGKVSLACASTASASLLLNGGKTLHAQFKVPININEDSVCNIKRGSRLAELILVASIIIIDEVTMISRHVLEALDRTLRDLKRNPNGIFGGIPVVLSGRNILILCMWPGPFYDLFNVLR